VQLVVALCFTVQYRTKYHATKRLLNQKIKKRWWVRSHANTGIEISIPSQDEK
jgi:hypothetical protein